MTPINLLHHYLQQQTNTYNLTKHITHQHKPNWTAIHTTQTTNRPNKSPLLTNIIIDNNTINIQTNDHGNYTQINLAHPNAFQLTWIKLLQNQQKETPNLPANTPLLKLLYKALHHPTNP